MEEFGFHMSEGAVSTHMSNFSWSNRCEVTRYSQTGRWDELDSTLEDVLRSLLIVYYIAGCFLGTSLNLFLIVLVIKFKKLHRVDFFLTLQIVFADLILSAILLPISTTNAIARRWIFNPGFCHFAGFLGFLVLEIRSSFLFILTLDRLCNVFFPLRYPRIQTRVTTVLSLSTWTLSVMVPIVPLHGLFDCYSYAPNIHGCSLGRACKHQELCDAYAFLTLVVLNSIVLIALAMYFVMYFKARKVNARVMHANSTNRGEAAALQQRRSRQVMVTIALYFLALFLLSSPQFLLTAVPLILQDLMGFELPLWHDIVHITTSNIVLSLSFVDPVVLMRNGDVHAVVKKITNRLKEKLKKLRQRSTAL